jgi:DNA-directed RNA polymerase subunit beta'
LARIAEVTGTASFEEGDEQITIVITDSAGEEHRYSFPRRTLLYVKDGQHVEMGTPLNEGSLLVLEGTTKVRERQLKQL